MSVISKDTTFLGYRRENGRVGVRNHVIVLPLDDLSNSAAEAVASTTTRRVHRKATRIKCGVQTARRSR